MKKRRLFLIMSIMLVLIMLFVMSSSVFELSSVEVKFYTLRGQPRSISSNKVYNSTEKTQEVLTSAQFDYGSLVFSLDKHKYISRIENAHPYIKVLSLENIFPNKLVLNALEREELFCILGAQNILVLDSEFKILDMRESVNSLCPITFFDRDRQTTFYDFFDVSCLAFEEGMFLSENNLVFEGIINMLPIISSFGLNLIDATSTLLLTKRDNNIVDLALSTPSPYGIVLQICNIFEQFDYKLNKLLSAFCTLIQKEKIKITHGRLVVDENLNCRWQET